MSLERIWKGTNIEPAVMAMTKDPIEPSDRRALPLRSEGDRMEGWIDERDYCRPTASSDRSAMIDCAGKGYRPKKHRIAESNPMSDHAPTDGIAGPIRRHRRSLYR